MSLLEVLAKVSCAGKQAAIKRSTSAFLGIFPRGNDIPLSSSVKVLVHYLQQ